MRVLHVVNYGWPHIDGYTARSRSLVSAQRTELGLDTVVATSPFPVFARASDPELQAPGWGPEQLDVTPAKGRKQLLPERAEAAWLFFERPALGLAPVGEGDFRRGLERVIEQVRPQVVHAHHPAYIGRSALAAAQANSVPLVYEVRCFNGDYDLDRRHPYPRARGRRQNGLEMALCARADHVVTLGDAMAARIVGSGVDPDTVSVVGNAVDTRLWSPVPHKPEPGVVRVGYATTFEAIENLDGLLVAVARVRTELRHLGLRLEVVLAGAGRDWDRIAGLVAQAELNDTVQLPGFLSLRALRELYSNLDLFVVPRGRGRTTDDTTPLKPLEAVAAGLPVLATDLPAMRELLADQSGVRFVPASIDGLTEGLVGFARDPWTAPETPELGTRSWARQVHRYRDVYRAVGVDV